MSIPFIDLSQQRLRLGARIEAGVKAVIESGAYILGPQVKTFEAELAAFGGAEFAISCANGTDSLALILQGLDVGPGDAVFCPAFTFVATAEVVPWVGAEPVFIDIDPVTYNLDVTSLERAILEVRKNGRLKPAAIIAVDLFGQPADYPKIKALADAYGLKLIADSAQGFGCTLQDKHPLHWADATSTSFYPAKPLGAYGDGGAILTNDASLAEKLVSLRVHGGATASDIAAHNFGHEAKYLNVRNGRNSRLDTLQAAILIEKLSIFAEEIELRQTVAQRYYDGLAGLVSRRPEVIAGGISTFAQYTVEHDQRDALAAHLRAAGVPTAVYYPIPLHKQPAYQGFTVEGGALPATDAAAAKVISLPFSPYLSAETQDQILAAVKAFGG